MDACRAMLTNGWSFWFFGGLVWAADEVEDAYCTIKFLLGC
jgi:hypothetical protein